LRCAPSLTRFPYTTLFRSVLIAINLQTSFLTPPFGLSLFYLRGAAPKEITTAQIYLGVVPFIMLQVIGIALIWSFPTIATWLPRDRKSTRLNSSHVKTSYA